MVTGPLLLHTRRPTARSLELELEIPPDLVHFRGHFPGVPITPGVVQVDWAIRYARDTFPEVSTWRFRALGGIKFMRLMRPGARLQLLLEIQPERRELVFQYTNDGGAFSSGKVAFA
jgi:3-hydroxymyristoyl/3-hydroxydecanoyl-(acyl carrier protein) dehydratase